MNDVLLAASVPKNDTDINEDFFRVTTDEFIISDGATESFNPALWARIIVEKYISTTHPARKFLETAQQAYREKNRNVVLKWYQEELFEKGSFATLLATRYIRSRRRIEMEGVGDSCAFILYPGKDQPAVLFSWPYREPGQFALRPILLPSKGKFEKSRHWSKMAFTVRKNSAVTLILATDALSCWILENRHEPEKLRQLLNIHTANAFRAFVEEKRQLKEMKIDDVTIIRREIVA